VLFLFITARVFSYFIFGVAAVEREIDFAARRASSEVSKSGKPKKP
jgi:hypothetical protein